MKRDLAYIRAYERDLMEKDRLRDELFNAMWRMAYLKWDFDQATKSKMKNVRTLVDTAPSNALHNAAIALSNTVPRWDVAPYGSVLYEYQRVEKLEHCLATQFRKTNQRGVGTLLYDKMFSSILYDTIVTRIDDLEFQFKGVKKLSPLQRRVRSQGRFLGQVFDPRTIHVETGMGTFTSLLHVENLRAWDVYNYWKLYENNETDAGKRVAAALRQMDEKFTENPNSVRDMRLIFFEFINDDQILKHGYFTQEGAGQITAVPPVNVAELSSTTMGSRNTSSGANDIVFADEENELGFINWSVRIGGTRMETEPAYQVNPMLAPLHWGNSWETMNILRSLVLSEPIKRMLEEVREIQVTRDGNPLPVNADGVAVAFPGEDLRKLPTSPLDQNALGIVQQLEQEIIKTTGANVLSDVTSAKTTPFATLNAMIQVAMSRLDINRRDGALSCADDALLMLRWVEKTQVPLMDYRRYASALNYGGQAYPLQAGEQITVTANDFDADQCEINVDIKPKTPTDAQQQILSAIQLHDKLQVPLEYLLENYVGIENVPLLRNQYEDELLKTSQMQTMIQVAAQTMMAKAAQENQSQQPPPQGAEAGTSMPPAGGGISQSAMGALNGLGQGVNPAMAGTAPQTFAPGMTREAVSGQTQGGAPIQAGG